MVTKPKRVVATLLMLVGLLSLGSSIDSGLPAPGVDRFLVYVVLSVAYGGMILGGALLLWRPSIGLWVTFLALVPQVPIFRLGQFSYMVMTYPSVEAKLFPKVGFAVGLSNPIIIGLSSSSRPTYVGLNMLALLLAGWVAVRIERMWPNVTRDPWSSPVDGGAG